MNVISDFAIAVLATIFFSYLFKVPKRAVLSSSVIGGAGYALYDLLMSISGSALMGYFLGTLLIAISSEILARTKKMPATVFVIPGIAALVPGNGLYMTMMYMVQQNASMAAQTGMKTMTAIVSMAMALVLTSIITTGIAAFLKRFVNKKQA